MIEKCPKCGGTTGYTSYSYARGVVKYDKPWSDKPRNRRGSVVEHDNSDMYDRLTYTPNKYVVCMDCDKRLDINQ